MKTIIVDNGHGAETPGKRSPIWADGTQLLEWQFNRKVVKEIAKALKRLSIPYQILVPEDRDISLGERCKRANAIHKAAKEGAILISVHANAGGGTGWECFTSKGSTAADRYATILCEEAKRCFPLERMRFDHTDGDPDKEEDFYILKNTACPAVLTENFFMDTEKDCMLILSSEGVLRVALLHIEAIKKMVNYGK